MQQCSSCRFWWGDVPHKWEPANTWGTCAKTQRQKDGSFDTLMLAWEDGATFDCYQMIKTRNDFGCVMFESKEPSA